MKPRPWRLAGIFAALALLVSTAPASAQQVTSQAVLDRVTIVEGQTRRFQISNVTSRPRYHVHASVSGAFTAEAGDVTITTDNQRGEAQTITPDADAPRAHRNATYGTINFEVTANADSDGAGDETFGVRLCTTADCADGTVLGEWTVTVTEPAADTTLSGTGATLTIPGGAAVSVMEDSRNRDSRDQRATFRIDIATAPTSNIAVVAYTETGVSTGARTAPFARINSALSPDYPPHGDDNHDDVEAEYLVGYWASGATGSQEFTVISTDNAVDTPGGTIAGDLKFKVFVDDEAFRTTLSGSSSDTAYGNATVYSGISVPDLPVRVTDDDEPTRVRLLPTSPADNAATEGGTDKATVLVRLDRALAAGEEATALLTFLGATPGTHFTLAAAGGQTGVAYADSEDGTQGLVTFSGAGAQEGVIEVTALMDSDSDSQTLQIGMPPFDQPWRPNFHRSNLDGGVCAAHGCPNRPPGDPGQRFQSVTLAEAVPGLTVIEHEDPEMRQVTEGGEYSYTIRLNTAPSNDVTVTVTIASGGTVTTRSLVFTPTNFADPQTVTVRADGDDDDGPRGTMTVTHAFSGDSAYAGLPDATHEVAVLDDDPTTVTMAGAGVRPGGSGANISRIMVEGDASRVDRTLTLTLGRALEAGEYVRVPLRIEAVANGNDPSLPADPPDQGDGDPDLPGDLDPRRPVVDSHRGPRASANVAWPPHHNDFVMTATGTGVSYEHSNRYTPNHIGFRYVEFRGAGARTATIVLHARDGFDDGETHDEAFAITFPNDFRVFDEDTDQPFTSSPVEGNLGGGVQAMPADAEAWFGIADDDALVQASTTIVPNNWPLKPPGLTDGDSFRLLYVTSGTRNARDDGFASYNDFVRAEINSGQLKQGGVPDLRPYADRFAAVISADSGTGAPGGNATLNANLEAAGSDAPIYWVGGTKVADDKADFLDGGWDDEAGPRHADGSAATISTNGYWTGSEADGQRSDRCSGLSGSDRHLRAGATNVSYGLLNDSTRGPLGQAMDETNCAPAPRDDLRPLYALSTEAFTVTPQAAIVARAEAAEGGPVTFTVTITSAAPAGGITIPYTLSDGRGVSSDPAHIIAGSSDYTDAASGSIVIAQGATTGVITVNTTGDSTYESDHYFTVTLGTPTGTDAPSVDSRAGSAIGIITDDADRPTFEFGAAAASVTEGTDTQVSLTVTKTGATEVASSVYWTTADGTAAHPGDYTADAGHLQFAPGDTSRTLTIDITDDDAGENAETFKVQLSQPSEATLGSASEATVTLNDDDGAVTSDVLVSWSQANDDPLPAATDLLIEGQTYTVKVSLAAAPSADVTIPIGVSNLFAAAGDYTVPTGVTIAGGSTSATFDFVVAADNNPESPEGVQLTLCPTATCPAGYTSGDAPPSFQVLFRDPGVVTDLSALRDTGSGFKEITEGASGTFTVRPEIDPVQDVTLSLKAIAGSSANNVLDIRNGTATPHIAFDADPGTDGFQSSLTFTGGDSGNWQTPRTVTVHALYDGDLSESRYRFGILNTASGGPYMSQVNTGAPTDLQVADAGNAVVVNPAAVTVAANETATYDMQLASDPGGTVVVTPTSGDAGKATVTGEAKTFTAGDWNMPQQVTVTGVDAGAATVSHAVTTGTAAYPTTMSGLPNVDVTVTAAAEVDITLSASDGDADGNAVEGAPDATGYRTVTLALGRALTAGETVTVPLTVRGATVATDHTFGLQPATQAGVTFTAGQNPTVQFASGAQTATLRFTPVNNSVRSQPAISISVGTPTYTGVTAGDVTGSPVVFSIVDDESGDITVPADWALKPSGLGGGDAFRLIFITSETRTAESTDIDDYNRWARGVVARGGHANLLPYGGLVTVIGTTAAVEARENTGIWDPDLNSGSGGYTDGSASASDSGMKIYWLAAPPAYRVADSYFEFHDDAGWEGGTDQSGTDTIESGASRTSSSAYWTGSYPNGTKLGGNENVLGTTQSTVAVGAADTAGFNSIFDGAAFTKTNSLPMMGISPVFEVATPELSFDSGGAFSVAEGGTATVTVTSNIAAPAATSVAYTVTDVSATGGTDYDAPSGAFALTAGATSHSFTIDTTQDTAVEGDETFTVRLDSGMGYTVGSPDTATVTITDDDTAVATPEISMTLQTGEGSRRNTAGQLELNEAGGVAGATFNLSADGVLAATLTVCLRVAEAGGDLLASAAEGIKTATLTSSGNANGAGIYQLTWTGDTDDERNSVVTATLLAPEAAGCSAANGSYTVSSAMASDAVSIEDDDATTVELTSSDRDMAEGDATDTATLTLTLGRRLHTGEAVVVPFTLATSTGARLPGHSTPDFTVSASGAGVTIARDSTATPSLTFTGHGTNVVQTATVTLTPVANRDDGDMDHEAVTATLASNSVLGSTAGSGTTVGGGAARGTSFMASLRLTDDESGAAPELTFGSATYSVAEDGGMVSVTVNAAPAPGNALTVNLSSASGTAGLRDYGKPAATFVFPASQTSHTFSVTIRDDDLHEDDETFTLTLDAASDASYTLGSPATATVTITSDDPRPPPVVSVHPKDAVGVEGANNSASVELRLSRALESGETLTVPYSLDLNAGANESDDGVTLTHAPGDPSTGALTIAGPNAPQGITLRLSPAANSVDSSVSGVRAAEFKLTGVSGVAGAEAVAGADSAKVFVNDGSAGRSTYMNVSGGSTNATTTRVVNGATTVRLDGSIVDEGGKVLVLLDGKAGWKRNAGRPYDPHNVTVGVQHLTTDFDDLGAAYAGHDAFVGRPRRDESAKTDYYNVGVLGMGFSAEMWIPVNADAAGEGDERFRVFIAGTPGYMGVEGAYNATDDRAPGVDFTIRGQPGGPQRSPSEAPPPPPAPTQAVSNVQVTAVDANNARATWDAVEHATGYEVAWDALDGDGQSIAAGLDLGVAGTSETIAHNAPGAASLEVTVTPQYVDGNGDTQTLAGLAGTATINLGSTGNGDSVGDGGTGGGDSGTGDPTPASSCVGDAQWGTVEGYYKSNAGKAPKYGSNWYRVLIAYRLEDADRALPAWTGATEQPTAAYTVKEAEDGEKVWGGWTPVRKVLECLRDADLISRSFVPLVPAASNPAREGVVRIANRSARAGAVRIAATDDAGWRPEPLQLQLGAGQSIDLTSADLERGNAAKGLRAGTGPGMGDWRLDVSSGLDLGVRPFVRAADGASAAMHGLAEAADGVHAVWTFNPADGLQQTSLLRVMNLGAEPVAARITGIDDAGVPGGAVTLEVPARAAATFTAAELERGGSGLEGALGDGHGRWRLRVASAGELAVMNLAVSPFGHLTNLSGGGFPALRDGRAHPVPHFPPASDGLGRLGLVRVVNESARGGEVHVLAHDAAGRRHGPLTLRLGPGGAAQFDSWDLEFGGEASGGLSGGTGPGVGPWRLEITSGLDIVVRSYVATPAGSLKTAREFVAGPGPLRWGEAFAEDR